MAYGKRIKLYPLSQAANPPQTTFVDAVDVVFDGVIPYDVRFFESLHRMVQAEPWLERDRAMIDPLKSIGIEQGKPFKPDQKTDGHLRGRRRRSPRVVRSSATRLATRPTPAAHAGSFRPTRRYVKAVQTASRRPTSIRPTRRGTLYYFVFTSVKHPRRGPVLPVRDAATRTAIRSTAPPPIAFTCRRSRRSSRYWSAVLYDFATHALIRDMPHASKSSQSPGLQTNADGSVDVYFAPKAPAGKESNWVPTDAKGRFEALFRFYGPEKPLFDKTWVLPDIEKIS